MAAYLFSCSSNDSNERKKQDQNLAKVIQYEKAQK